MEKIYFSNSFFINKKIKIFNNQAIIIGDNGVGKTEILNTLELGFKGKLNNFLVDDQPVSLDQYQVVYLKEFINFKELIKLSKTSLLRNGLIKIINEEIIKNQNYKNIFKKLEDTHHEFFNLIEESYFKKIKFENYETLKLKPTLENFTINNLIDKMLKIQFFDYKINNLVDEENCSHYFLRILIFNVLQSLLDINDEVRNRIILFDLPELYGAPKTIFKFSKYLREISKNNIVIIVTNSSEFLKILKPNLLSINLVTKNNIYFISNYSEIIRNAIIAFSFCESNNFDLSVYKYSLNPLIEEVDIEKEIEYVNKNLYNFIIEGLFSEKIELYLTNFNNSPNFDIYIVKYFLKLKDLIFIYNIFFSAFNLNISWKNYEENKNFLKLLPYFN